jgi:hypothetical protein
MIILYKDELIIYIYIYVNTQFSFSGIFPTYAPCPHIYAVLFVPHSDSFRKEEKATKLQETEMKKLILW